MLKLKKQIEIEESINQKNNFMKNNYINHPVLNTEEEKDLNSKPGPEFYVLPDLSPKVSFMKRPLSSIAIYQLFLSFLSGVFLFFYLFVNFNSVQASQNSYLTEKTIFLIGKTDEGYNSYDIVCIFGIIFTSLSIMLTYKFILNFLSFIKNKG